MLVTFGGAIPLFDFSNGGIEPSLAVNALLRVVALMLFGVGEASAVIFFYLFPSGRFAPRWTRWGAVCVVTYYALVVFFPVLPSNAGGPASYLILLFFISAVVAQVYRYRRVSTPVERQQTKWVVLGIATATAAFFFNIPLGALLPAAVKDSVILGNLNPIFPYALLLIPVSIALAVSRTRLWDIDVLINRALVYGALTALLAATYAGLILGLEGLAGLAGGAASQGPVVLVVSTLAVAALFSPLRRRIQRLIDRRFYRAKYDTARTLERFAATLRQDVDLSGLRDDLLGAVEETMHPAHISLWLAVRTPPIGGVE
jgi:hypothetical protein